MNEVTMPAVSALWSEFVSKLGHRNAATDRTLLLGMMGSPKYPESVKEADRAQKELIRAGEMLLRGLPKRRAA